MAKIPGNQTRIYVDEFALAGYLNATATKFQQATPEVTAFADAGPRRIVDNYDHSGNSAGLFDAVAGAVDDLLHNALNTDEDHYLLQAYEGDADGKTGYERIIRLSDQARTAKGGDAQMLDFSEVGSGECSRSTIVANAAITGTGNQTGRNLGATTSGQLLQVVYRVLAVSGSGTIIFQLQESSDDGAGDAYAAITGMGATFTAVGVQRFTTSAATEAWKRVRANTFSGFTSVTALVTVGRVQS